MSTNILDGIHWWTPIPWVLAVFGIAVAVFVYRRNRCTAVRFHHITSYGTSSTPDSEVWQLIAEVLCTGADIFDARLFLECYYQPSRNRHNWPDVLALEFTSATPLPNPIKNGQVVRFTLTDDHLQRAIELNGGYYCLPSLLPRRRIRLALYASGERLIAITSSRVLRRFLRLFERSSAPFVRTDRSGSYYAQPPVAQLNRNA